MILEINTKIVYVLSSGNADFYLEETWMSIISLRKYHPEAIVEIVADQDTCASFVGYREKFTSLVNMIHQEVCPDRYSLMQRSRYLKTNLRNIIAGDYLFIDSDTIIAGKLDSIDNIATNIAAVRDYRVPVMGRGKTWFEKAETMGWGADVTDQPYYNSGVMLVKDNDEAHRFYELWHQLWLECNDKNVFVDQISLCKANTTIGYLIQPLPECWNFQIKFYPIAVSVDGAKIFHYFSSVKTPLSIFDIELPYMYQTIRGTGQIPQTIVEQINKPSVLFSKRFVKLSRLQKRILYGSFFESMYCRLLQGLARRFPNIGIRMGLYS